MLSKIMRGVSRRLSALSSEVIDGYEQAELVETVFQKTKDFAPQDDWLVMAGQRSVLDFGGGCGIHYKQAQRQAPDIRWAVVETDAMASRARELETDKLRFFSDIKAAARWLDSIDMVYSNGALQYAPDPLARLQELCDLRARTMLWERMAFSSSDQIEQETQSSFLQDNGPGATGISAISKDKILKVSHFRIPEAAFLAAHKQHYDLAERNAQAFRFVTR